MAKSKAEKKQEEQLNLRRLRTLVDKVYNSQEYKDRRTRWRRYLKEFTGQWWNDEIDAFDSRVFVNFLFSTIQSAAPLLTDNRPVWNVVSRLGFMQKLANLYSRGLHYLWDVIDMDHKTYQSVMDMLLYGTAVAKVAYDPDEDEVWTDIIDPSTFVIAEGYTDEWKAPWCGTITQVPYTWVLTTYPEVAKTVKPKTKSGSEGEEEENLTNTAEYEMLTSDTVKVYELWIKDASVEKYMRTEQVENGKGETEEREVEDYRAKYPNGRIVIFTEDGVLLEDKASPFRHGKPPYVKLVDYEIPHHFWGQGEADQIESLNRELNLRVQDIVDHARKHTKVNYVKRDNCGITDEQLKEAIKKGDQVLTVRSDLPLNDIVAQLQTPDINRSVMDLVNIIPRFIEEVTGVTETSKGQVSKKQRQSAHELSILIESSYTRTRQKVRNFERFIKRLATLHLELMQQFYTEPRPIAFRTENDEVATAQISNNPADMLQQMKPEFADDVQAGNLEPQDLEPEERQELDDFAAMIDAFDGADEIYGDFIVQIDTNSTLPMDQQAMANLAMRLGEQGVIDPLTLLKVLRFPYRNEVEERMKEMQQQEQQGPPQQGPPRPPQGGRGPNPAQVLAQMSQGA